MLANFHMENSENIVESTATYDLVVELWYIENIFVIWNKGEGELQSFLNYLNSIYQSIQFMVEMEKESELSFVMKNNDGTLGHRVFRKPTHKDHYLHSFKHYILQIIILNKKRIWSTY